MTAQPFQPFGAPTGLHPVALKLQRQILPYTESAKSLHRQWFYRLHTLFGYATDITVALGAVGIGLPLLNALTKPSGEGSGGAPVTQLLPADPGWLYALALFSVVVWIVLRVAFNREEGQKKAVLAKSCRHTMRQAEATLYNVLDDPDPMPALQRLVQEHIKPTVDRNIQEGAWPWSGPSPDVDPAVESRLSALRQRFETTWRPVDPNGLRSGGA